MGKQKDINLRIKCLKKSFLRAVESGKCSFQDVVNQVNAEAPSHCTQVLSESVTLIEKRKDINLRIKCLKKTFLRAMESGKCSFQDVVNQVNAEAPSHCTQVLSESVPLIEKQLSATRLAEQKIQIPSKRLLEVDGQTLMPSKKKSTSQSSKHTPNHNRPIGDLDVLPQIKSPVFLKCPPMPLHVLLLYVQTRCVLKNVEQHVKSFFEDYENSEESNTEASTSDVLSSVDGDLVFKEISSFRERHEYMDFYNINLLLGQLLKEAIVSSNEYLSILRQAVKELPVYPHMTKLITLFNKIILRYRTVCRHRVLVKTLLIKFNNKHGLPIRFFS